MTIDLEFLYPAGYDLKTPERKALYADLVKITEHHFANMPPAFTKSFKKLFFEGVFESETAFDRYSALYICLSSPVVEKDFFAEIFSFFGDAGRGSALYMIRTYIDPSLSMYPVQLERWRTVLLALDSLDRESRNGVTQEYVLLFLNSLFSELAYCGSSEYSLGLVLFNRANDEFEVACDQLSGNSVFECIQECIEKLLSSNAEDPRAYSDPWFTGFCCRYFERRDLNPAFLGFCDRIYQSISEEKRITWSGNRILCPGQ